MQDNQNDDQTQGSSLQAESSKFSAMAIAGLVLGIIALISSWVPILNNASFFIGLLGFVFCIIAVVSTFRERRRGKVLSVIAAVICIISMVLVIATQGIYSSAIDEAVSGSGVVGVVDN